MTDQDQSMKVNEIKHVQFTKQDIQKFKELRDEIVQAQDYPSQHGLLMNFVSLLIDKKFESSKTIDPEYDEIMLLTTKILESDEFLNLQENLDDLCDMIARTIKGEPKI